jgi:hypothetical protein
LRMTNPGFVNRLDESVFDRLLSDNVAKKHRLILESRQK